MLDWISKLFYGFIKPQSGVEEHSGDASRCPFLNPGLVKAEPEEKSATTVVNDGPTSPTYPKLYDALMKFKPGSDVLVISEEYVSKIAGDTFYEGKLKELGDKVIVFPKGTLVEDNVAIVTTGYSSYTYGWKKT